MIVDFKIKARLWQCNETDVDDFWTFEQMSVVTMVEDELIENKMYLSESILSGSAVDILCIRLLTLMQQRVRSILTVVAGRRAVRLSSGSHIAGRLNGKCLFGGTHRHLKCVKGPKVEELLL